MIIEPHTDAYFWCSNSALLDHKVNRRVVYQVFQKKDAVLCGTEYVKQLIYVADRDCEIWSLEDGENIAPYETVMLFVGSVTSLIELETIYLGYLSRMTRVATNIRRCVEASNGKPVLFFSARFDVPEVQEYDGYAAFVGGASGVSTIAQAGSSTRGPVGTMPHALIAAVGGDTVTATIMLAESLPDSRIVSLVDFSNDCVGTSVAVFKAMKERGLPLYGVRLDTSEKMCDVSTPNCSGVNIELVRKVRAALDLIGGDKVQIVVSGGFTPDKIKAFEEARTPVDQYAVGEFCLSGSNPFTSDIVAYYDGTRLVACAKEGRRYTPSARLVGPFKLDEARAELEPFKELGVDHP